MTLPLRPGAPRPPHPSRGADPAAAALIAAAAAGRMAVVQDGEAEDSRGALVLPAAHATAAAIAFMARHGRGLVCLALTGPRLRALGLPPPASSPAMGAGLAAAPDRPAFTTSIEAREGVTTGISAADRARTIAVAIDPAQGSEALVTPGHVFPLEAREGGVLLRPGLTEAAVDLARLAGLPPAGVICTILDEQGEVARAPFLAVFAARHGLVLGSIPALLRHRRGTEPLVLRREEAPLPAGLDTAATAAATWRALVFAGTHDGREHLALVLGDPAAAGGPIPVRIHPGALLPTLLRPGQAQALRQSMAEMARRGQGILIWLQPGQGGAAAELGLRGRPAWQPEGAELELAGAMLRELGVREMEPLGPAAARLAAAAAA